MAQNWTSIVEFSWIFSNIYLLIYIYMTYKFEFFLVIQKEKGS